jgi:hypothetical protein
MLYSLDSVSTDGAGEGQFTIDRPAQHPLPTLLQVEQRAPERALTADTRGCMACR